MIRICIRQPGIHAKQRVIRYFGKIDGLEQVFPKGRDLNLSAHAVEKGIVVRNFAVVGFKIIFDFTGMTEIILVTVTTT